MHEKALIGHLERRKGKVRDKLDFGGIVSGEIIGGLINGAFPHFIMVMVDFHLIDFLIALQ